MYAHGSPEVVEVKESNISSYEDNLYSARQASRLPFEMARDSLNPEESNAYFNDETGITPENYSLCLLKQEYYFLLKPKGKFTPERNVIYFNITEKGHLQYFMINAAGKKVEVTTEIHLGDSSLTLDLLESMREMISNHVSMDGNDVLPEHKIQPHKIYLSQSDTGTISYTVKTQGGSGANMSEQKGGQVVIFETDIEAPVPFTIENLIPYKGHILQQISENAHFSNLNNFAIVQQIPVRTHTLVTDKAQMKPTDLRLDETEVGCIRDADGKLRLIGPGRHQLTSEMQFIGKSHFRNEHIVFNDCIHIITVKPDQAFYAQANNRSGFKLLTEGVHFIVSPTLMLREIIDFAGLDVKIKKTPIEIKKECELKPDAPVPAWALGTDSKAEPKKDAAANKSKEKPIEPYTLLYCRIPGGKFNVFYDNQGRMVVVMGPAVVRVPSQWRKQVQMTAKEDTYEVVVKTRTLDNIEVEATNSSVNVQIEKPAEAIRRYGPNKILNAIRSLARKNLEEFVASHRYDDLKKLIKVKDPDIRSFPAPSAPDLSILPPSLPSYDDAMKSAVVKMQQATDSNGDSVFGECIKVVSLHLGDVKPCYPKVVLVLEEAETEALRLQRLIENQSLEQQYLQNELAIESDRSSVHYRKQTSAYIRAEGDAKADQELAQRAVQLSKPLDTQNKIQIFKTLREQQYQPTMFISAPVAMHMPTQSPGVTMGIVDTADAPTVPRYVASSSSAQSS